MDSRVYAASHVIKLHFTVLHNVPQAMHRAQTLYMAPGMNSILIIQNSIKQELAEKRKKKFRSGKWLVLTV